MAYIRLKLTSTVATPPDVRAGGDDGNRTHDPLLAGQVLSQLSYTPILLNEVSEFPFGHSKLNNNKIRTRKRVLYSLAVFFRICLLTNTVAQAL